MKWRRKDHGGFYTYNCDNFAIVGRHGKYIAWDFITKLGETTTLKKAKELVNCYREISEW